MNKPVLVIMAAGMGSRFGGMKQITPVDQAGHNIMDFSVYDAVRAGFEKVILIIKEENEADFRRAVGDRISKKVELEYAYQKLDALPQGIRVPEGRTKPWGTGHAVLCAAEKIRGPFAVINADDFYGRGAFETAYRFLSTTEKDNEHCLVGYRLENTLTENGYVARGICRTDAEGMLSGITERTKIRIAPGGAEYTEDDGASFTFLPGNTIVSLNLWGFGRAMLDELQSGFRPFLEKGIAENPLKCEYFLPSAANRHLTEGRGTVRVLPTEETWYGVTYREDLQSVQNAVSRMKEQGIYPEKLWD